MKDSINVMESFYYKSGNRKALRVMIDPSQNRPNAFPDFNININPTLPLLYANQLASAWLAYTTKLDYSLYTVVSE